MPGLNKVMLIGHLGRDPETRWFEGGKVMSKLSLATSETYKDDEGQSHQRTEWHNVVLWRKLAEVADAHLSKGDRVYIEGRLRTRTWQDAEGQQHRATEIVADRMDMLGGPHSPNREAESGTGRPQAAPTAPEPMDGAPLPF